MGGVLSLSKEHCAIAAAGAFDCHCETKQKGVPSKITISGTLVEALLALAPALMVF